MSGGRSSSEAAISSTSRQVPSGRSRSQTITRGCLSCANRAAAAQVGTRTTGHSKSLNTDRRLLGSSTGPAIKTIQRLPKPLRDDSLTGTALTSDILLLLDPPPFRLTMQDARAVPSGRAVESIARVHAERCVVPFGRCSSRRCTFWAAVAAPNGDIGVACRVPRKLRTEMEFVT